MALLLGRERNLGAEPTTSPARRASWISPSRDLPRDAALAAIATRYFASHGPAALLPPWDEYLVAYKDRDASLGHLPGNEDRMTMIVGKSLLIIDGRVRATWKRTLSASTVRVTIHFWTRATDADRRAATKAADRYGRFLGTKVLVAMG